MNVLSLIQTLWIKARAKSPQDSNDSADARKKSGSSAFSTVLIEILPRNFGE